MTPLTISLPSVYTIPNKGAIPLPTFQTEARYLWDLLSGTIGTQVNLLILQLDNNTATIESELPLAIEGLGKLRVYSSEVTNILANPLYLNRVSTGSPNTLDTYSGEHLANSFVEEAPMDGVTYYRKDGLWEALPVGLTGDAVAFTMDSSLVPDNTISIRINSRTIGTTIDWGEGAGEEVVSLTTTSHTYAAAGIKTVIVRGGGQIVLGVTTTGTAAVRAHLISALFSGFNFTSLATLFKGITSSFTLDGVIKTQGVSMYTEMFSGCTNFNSPLTGVLSLPPLAQVGVVSMFSGCAAFNQPVLAVFGTAILTNLTGLFRGCSSFNQDVSTLDVSQAQSFWDVFVGCTLFNQPLSSWQVNMPMEGASSSFNTFSGCASFNQDIRSWNLGIKPNLDYMFADCIAFNSPVWANLAPFSIEGMFRGCHIFNQPLTGWIFAEDMNGWGLRNLFDGAHAYNQPIDSWIVETNLFSFLDLSYMFAFAYAFNQPIDVLAAASISVENTSAMFLGAPSWLPSGHLPGVMTFNQDMYSWSTNNIHDMSAMFLGCGSFSQDISIWNVNNVTMCYDFRQDSGLFLSQCPPLPTECLELY